MWDKCRSLEIMSHDNLLKKKRTPRFGPNESVTFEI